MLLFEEQEVQGGGEKENSKCEYKVLFTEIKIEEIDMDIENALEIWSLL